MKIKQYMFVENEMGYYFSFISDKARYDDNVDEFEQIIMSFETVK